MIKIRLSISALALLAVLLIAGCGGSGGGSSSGSDSGPASLAAPGSLVYVEGNLKPTGTLKSNVDSVAKKVGGIDDLGEFVVSELESSAQGDGETVDFATEVEPWLGKTAGVAFERLEGSELSDPLIAIQTTDAKATQAFIDKQAASGKGSYKNLSYEGVDFKVGGSEGNAIGVIGEWAVIAGGEKAFKGAVDASTGDSLAVEDRFATAFDAASNGSIADIYVDVGGVLKQSGDKIDAQAQEVLQSSGIDPSEATAVASVIPGADQVEVDLSSELGGEKAPSGDVSKLLGTMPANSVAAFAASGFSEQVEEAIDNLDESGIPPELPPDKLKSIMAQGGIDLDKIAASLEDAAVYVEGSNRKSLGGALVVTSDGDEAAEAIASLGTLLRGARVPGVTAISGKASGFSIRSDELGGKPVVVAAEDGRIAIGYGLAQTLQGLELGSGPTLSGTAAYKEAVSSLGNTPISAYADGAGALQLAEALVPRSKTDFWEAVPYLKKIEYLALGAGPGDEPATAKLIAGLEK
jgi:Protein of unknown function (DUF3352)